LLLTDTYALALLHPAYSTARDGGTIPALAYFQDILGVPTTVFGFGLGDHIHAPNERYNVDMYHLGREAWVRVLHQVAEEWGSKAAGKVEL
jgi:acetylornithine deacetylase/succinyl-diaminopimelate desuccinylase-like protein